MTPMHPRARRSAIAAMAALLVVLVSTSPVAAFARRPIFPLPPPPLTGIVIAIDPGHNGGNATAASQSSYPVWVGSEWNPCNRSGTATKSGYPEHKFNWLTSLAVKSRLEQLGATVYFTHPTDTGVGPCVTVRSSLGTRVGAALEVSIHADGAASEFHGFHINHPGEIRLDRRHRRGNARAGQGDPRRDGRRGNAGGELLRDERPQDAGHARDTQRVGCADRADRVREHEERRRRGQDDEQRRAGRYADGIVAGIRRYLHL